MDLPTNRIAELREARGLSQVDVAALCRLKASVTVDRWEKGKTTIPTEQAMRLADFFGVSLDHLLGREPATGAAA